MVWKSRKYHFYLVFADIKAGEAPWERDVWITYTRPIFDEILKQSPYYDQIGLSSVQYVPASDSKYFDEMMFETLHWNVVSDEKWTLPPSEQRLFVNLNCWTPKQSTCEQNNQAPDVYFSIQNERGFADNKKTKFDLFIVVAIAEDLNMNGREQLKKLSGILNAKKTVHLTRPWEGSHAKETEMWEFLNSIQNTTTLGIYKGSTLNIHDHLFDDLVFQPYWEVVYEKDAASVSTPQEIIAAAKGHLHKHKISYQRLGSYRFTQANDPRNTYREAYWTVPYEYKVFEEELAFIDIHDQTQEIMMVITKHGIPYAHNKWIKSRNA